MPMQLISCMKRDIFCHIETSIRTFKIQKYSHRTLTLKMDMPFFYANIFWFIHHWTIAMVSKFKCTFQHLGFMCSHYHYSSLRILYFRRKQTGRDPLIREELSWFSLYCHFIAQGTQPKEHTPHSPRQEKLIYRPTLQSWWSTLYNRGKEQT